jgi:hypothetical protein
MAYTRSGSVAGTGVDIAHPVGGTGGKTVVVVDPAALVGTVGSDVVVADDALPELEMAVGGDALLSAD